MISMSTSVASRLLTTTVKSMVSRGFATGLGDSIQLPSEDGALLVRLTSRPWGGSAELSAAEISSSAFGDDQKDLPARVSVVRDAFYPYDEAPRPLNQIVKPLPKGSLAIHVDLAKTEERALVDEYVLDPASKTYKLKRMARDLVQVLGEAVAAKKNGGSLWLVPDVDAAGAAGTIPFVGASQRIRQSTNEVVMVAPTAFGFNEQAAQDNSFMHAAAGACAHSALTRQVLAEFAALHRQLTDVAGVQVNLFEHSLAHGTPDACFPNNWFSTHQAGEGNGGVSERTLVLYPMKCPNRALERRQDIVQVIKSKGYSRVIDLSPEEANRRYFEGTGVLVIDRVNGVAYVDISERADAVLARRWVEEAGYKELVAFHSSDLRGMPVYHTNVMMAIGTGVVIVCAESVHDERERKHLLARLRATHEVVEISLQQMDALCGNALEVEGANGLPYMAMSTQAYNAFTPAQLKTIRRHVVDIIHAPIDMLERVGGGSVRCTLAEIF